MTDKQKEWVQAETQLINAIKELGFPEELGSAIAGQLGGTKAMQRMLGYLYSVKPDNAELIVDEMLAICSDIDTWHKKKDAQEANAAYTDWLEYGPDDDSDADEDDWQ